MTPRDNLPTYVRRGGDIVWEPPFVCNDVHVHGFLFEVEHQRIDRMLQRDLVVPSHGAVDRRAAFPYVVVACATMGSASSALEPDSERGYITEKEVGFWCLTADAHAEGRLSWYLPYIFVDTAMTVAGGREVYGYPKQLGTFPKDFRERLAEGRKAKVSTLAIAEYGPCAELKPMDIFKVETVEDCARPHSDGSGRGFRDLFRGKISVDPSVPSGPAPGAAAVITAADDPPPPHSGPPPWYSRVLDDAHGVFHMLEEEVLIADMALNPTLVFLKQFRDIASSTKACYQAVVEARFLVDPSGASFRTLPASNYRITIADPDSSPIARDFGLKADTPLTPDAAFSGTFSFLGRYGSEIWRART